MYLILYLVSLVKMPVSQNPLTDYIYTILHQLVSLLIYSFLFSIIIGAAHLAHKSKFSFKESIKYSRFTFKNFIFLLPIVILYLLTSYFLKIYSPFGPLTTAIVNEIIFIFASSLAILFVMKKTLNAKPTSKKYLWTLLVLIIYYLLTFILDKFIELFSGTVQILAYIIIYFIIVYPIITLILVSIFEDVQTK